MRILRSEIVVPRPQEDVFAFATDLGQAPRWLAMIDQMSLVDPDAGLRLGARIRLDFTVAGKPRVQHTTVHRFEPPVAFALRTVEEGFDVTFAYGFEAVEDGTRVTLEVDVRPVSISAWIVFPFAIRGIRWRLSDRLQRLRAALEPHPHIP